MLTAYLDESGHEHKDWMFLAGFLGAEADWREYVRLWTPGLGKQRTSLHMNELRWKLDRTRKLLERLGPIPEQSGVVPAFGGVRYADYEDLVLGSPEEKTLKGYIICLIVLVTDILRRVPATERVEIILEEQRQYEPFANIALGILADPEMGPSDCNMTVGGKPKLARWAFVPKGSTIMLDAPDYLAFALRETRINGNSKKARWCQSILRTDPNLWIGKEMSRQEIRASVSGGALVAALAELERMKAMFKN